MLMVTYGMIIHQITYMYNRPTFFLFLDFLAKFQISLFLERNMRIPDYQYVMLIVSKNGRPPYKKMVPEGGFEPPILRI